MAQDEQETRMLEGMRRGLEQPYTDGPTAAELKEMYLTLERAPAKPEPISKRIPPWRYNLIAYLEMHTPLHPGQQLNYEYIKAHKEEICQEIEAAQRNAEREKAKMEQAGSQITITVLTPDEARALFGKKE